MNRTRKWMTWLLGLVLLAGAGAGVWFGYHKLKIRRADTLLSQSRALLDEGKLESALNKAQAALQLHPLNPPGLGLMAQVLAKAGRAEALEFWLRSVGDHPPTSEDRQMLIELAMQVRRFDIADAQLAEALRQPEVPGPVFILAAKFCDLTGNAAGAIRFGRSWHELRPASLEARFVLGKHLLASGNSDQEAEGKTLLAEVASSTHPAARHALSLLVKHPRLTAGEIRRVQGWLNLLPYSDPERDFEMIDLQLRLEPDREPEFMEAAIAHYANSAGEPLLRLARWLARRGSHERLLQAVPKERAFTHRELFLVCADALASLGRWKELDGWLIEKDVPLDAALAEIYRARVAGELGLEKQKSYHWAQAHWHAADQSAVLFYLARYAEATAETQEAIKAYQKLVKQPEWPGTAALSLAKLLRQGAQTRALRELMRVLEERFPNDPLPRNDRAYLDLLLEENISGARQVALTLVREHPQLLAYRTTLALASLRAGDLAGAQQAYADQQVEWSRATPAWQAVFSSVLGQSGEADAARQLMARIDQSQLLPEERTLLAISVEMVRSVGPD